MGSLVGRNATSETVSLVLVCLGSVSSVCVQGQKGGEELGLIRLPALMPVLLG